MAHELYENPLISRYASPEMSALWGAQKKFSTWRRLWVALAEAEKELGLPITEEQIAELRANVDNIDFARAAIHERRLRHDVMAHVHTYGEACPAARKIIHWGATSCFVTDNTDLILLRDGLRSIGQHLVGVIVSLGDFAERYADLPCLGLTHLQPAQPTTMGKRACLWAYDLVLDWRELRHRLSQMKARSVQGATGTQASFLALFDGDHEKVHRLEELVARKMGFDAAFAVTGQTYPRKVDAQILDVLAGVAQSAHKAATDIRLLAARKEVDEPFESEQIGSSAMAYKRNPMRSERICGLARFLLSLQTSAANTAAVQWMERTLDDSANRRLTLPQAFLATDAVLVLYNNIAQGLAVHSPVIERNLREELPFLATENIMNAAVRQGGDRQQLHERIRRHSHAAAAMIKEHGQPNDLLERLQSDEAFTSLDWEHLLDARNLVGRAPQQVRSFLAKVIEPLRESQTDAWQREVEIFV